MKRVPKPKVEKMEEEDPDQQYVKPGLNLHEIKEMRKIFQVFNLNGSGYVSPSGTVPFTQNSRKPSERWASKPSRTPSTSTSATWSRTGRDKSPSSSS